MEVSSGPESEEDESESDSESESEEDESEEREREGLAGSFLTWFDSSSMLESVSGLIAAGMSEDDGRVGSVVVSSCCSGCWSLGSSGGREV